jgi:sugar O-acyltransferase (sialic acid O-acetyltransferase NeuD family)
MKQAIYAVYGASGFGREVMPLVREQLLRNGDTIDEIMFVDDNRQADILNGYKVLTYEEFLSIESKCRYVVLAIAESSIRQKLVQRISADGMNLWPVVADNVVIMDQVEIADGGILCPFVTLTSNVKIGKCFHANIYSYVAHDCQIGDYVTFAPSVKCNGNVVVEDYVYIGTGAIIKQGKPGQPLVIGKNAVVGMGAVVTKSVPAGTTVIGNPAKPLIKK